MRQAVDYFVRGKDISGRRIKTRNVKDGADLNGVQLVFISGNSSPSQAEQIVSAAGGSPILTVSDLDRFCDKGGMISLLVEANRVKFEIRLDTTALAGLKVSSRVITLAKVLHKEN
jgi:hypothetical protein